jgi:hypothetical protein
MTLVVSESVTVDLRRQRFEVSNCCDETAERMMYDIKIQRPRERACSATSGFVLGCVAGVADRINSAPYEPHIEYRDPLILGLSSFQYPHPNRAIRPVIPV